MFHSQTTSSCTISGDDLLSVFDDSLALFLHFGPVSAIIDRDLASAFEMLSVRC